jgi:serine/threonine-protein kinase PknK
MAESVPGYRDLARIGHGGFSVVYRAHQEAFDRTVALKILRTASDEEVNRRFLREVKLTGRLTGHPHVVTILDAGTTESGQPYLATELYEGGSLKDRLRADGPLPAAEVAAIGAKIAEALSAAHELGIVHRDVKPGNILVSRFGEPALADFGVGCLLDAAASGTVLNSFSPHHAAPEVMSRSSPIPASDVYSLGSTMYELLTGRPPFGGDGEEIAAVLWKIVHEPAPPVQCPELPGLAEAIGRALAKEPDDRQASAAAFARQLRALIRSEPGGAMAVPAAEAAAAGAAEAASEAEAGQGQVPAAAMKVYVSAFEPVAAGVAAAPPGSDDPPEPAAQRRQRWPLFAGAGFALTVLISLAAALVWSSPSKGAVAGPPTESQTATPGGTAVGVKGKVGSTSSSGATGGSTGIGPGASPGSSQSAVGTGSTGVAKSPAPGTSVTNSPAIVPSTSPAAAPTSEPTTKTCTGWFASLKSNSTATAVGNDRLRPGPYAACAPLTKINVGDAVNVWCSVVNTNGVIWVYAELSASTSAAGWVPTARIINIVGTINPC